MRIVILTIKKQIYAPLIIKQLLPEHEVAAVFTTPLSGHKKNLLQNIKFVIEKSGFLYLFLRAAGVIHNLFLTLTNPEFNTINSFCKKRNIPIYPLDNVNSEETFEKLQKIKPDIVISLFFNQIIKDKIISVPKYGCLNVHRSPLPKFRGSCSAFWQMSENKKDSATTIHYIDPGTDTGDIVSQIKYRIEKKDTHHSVCLKSAKAANTTLSKVLEKIEKNEIKKIKQNEKEATVYPFPTHKAAWEFIKKRKRMF